MKHIIKSIVIIAVCSVILEAGQPEKKYRAPNFSLQTRDGKVIELAQLRGKVVLVNFWATWCPPCRAEIPDFIEVYNEYKSKGFEIIGIALDKEGWSKVAPFIAKSKINYPIVLGTSEVIDRFGGIESIPTTFLIDRQGLMAGMQVGSMSKAELESALQRLLQ